MKLLFFFLFEDFLLPPFLPVTCYASRSSMLRELPLLPFYFFLDPLAMTEELSPRLMNSLPSKLGLS